MSIFVICLYLIRMLFSFADIIYLWEHISHLLKKIQLWQYLRSLFLFKFNWLFAFYFIILVRDFSLVIFNNRFCPFVLSPLQISVLDIFYLYPVLSLDLLALLAEYLEHTVRYYRRLDCIGPSDDRYTNIGGTFFAYIT